MGLGKLLLNATKRIIKQHKEELKIKEYNFSIMGEKYKETLTYDIFEFRIAWIELKLSIVKGLADLFLIILNSCH